MFAKTRLVVLGEGNVSVQYVQGTLANVSDELWIGSAEDRFTLFGIEVVQGSENVDVFPSYGTMTSRRHHSGTTGTLFVVSLPFIFFLGT